MVVGEQHRDRIRAQRKTDVVIDIDAHFVACNGCAFLFVVTLRVLHIYRTPRTGGETLYFFRKSVQQSIGRGDLCRMLDEQAQLGLIGMPFMKEDTLKPMLEDMPYLMKRQVHSKRDASINQDIRLAAFKMK